MPFHKIVSGMAFKHCVKKILGEVPGKAMPNVSKEFVIKRMRETGLHHVCVQAAQARRIDAEKLVNKVADKVREELLIEKGYKA